MAFVEILGPPSIPASLTGMTSYDELAGKLTEIFQCDSLDLVELTNDDRRKRPETKDGR